ncbi:MAG: BON domain-containing protein [Acidobacteria bacterium]|nr:BON domain-containing protein [Acidobacteriota bacterium]
MSYDEEQRRRSRVVVETPTARREEYVTQTRRYPEDRGGYSAGVVAAVALTAIALTALVVFFMLNRGSDATQTNVNVTTAATPLPTQPTPLVIQQMTPMPAQPPPIIVQQPPTTTTAPAPVIVTPPAPTGGATAPAPADDSAIEARVNKALNDDADISSLGITVAVINGRATLNGLVKTADQKARAEQIAHAARGVKAVDNKIIVEGQ